MCVLWQHEARENVHDKMYRMERLHLSDRSRSTPGAGTSAYCLCSLLVCPVRTLSVPDLALLLFEQTAICNSVVEYIRKISTNLTIKTM